MYLICKHQSGIGKEVSSELARALGKEHWSNKRVCDACFKTLEAKFTHLMESMPVLTVPLIEGYTIEKYFGVVTGQSVIGTGIISEFIAGFTDFFGGRSGAFESKLAQGEAASILVMKQKALKMGANAIIGVDIDYGELGASKGMIMITATGTAVRWNKA